MLEKYPIGSDITVMDVRYSYPEKNENDKWTKGAITIVAKDNTTGKKFIETIDNPDYEYYIAKDDVNIEHNLLFIDKEKVLPLSFLSLALQPLSSFSKRVNVFRTLLKSFSVTFALHRDKRLEIFSLNVISL